MMLLIPRLFSYNKVNLNENILHFTPVFAQIQSQLLTLTHHRPTVYGHSYSALQSGVTCPRACLRCWCPAEPDCFRNLASLQAPLCALQRSFLLCLGLVHTGFAWVRMVINATVSATFSSRNRRRFCCEVSVYIMNALLAGEYLSSLTFHWIRIWYPQMS